MQLADSLIENTNDFATASTLIFDSIDTQTDKLSHRQLMRHKLLQLKVRNKQDRLTEADTAFTLVADYYRRHGSPNEQVEALYLLARVYHNMGRLPQAIDLYQQADQAADTTRADCDYYTINLIYGSISDIYCKQALPDEEIKIIKETGIITTKNNDDFNAIKLIERQIRPYYDLGDTNMVIQLADSARVLYKKHGYENIAARALSIPITIAINRGQYDKAKIMLEELEQKSGMIDSKGNILYGLDYYFGYYYENKGKFMEGINKLDSAIYYYNLALNKHLYEIAYEGLFSVYTKKNLTDSIAKYAKLYTNVKNSSLAAKNSILVKQIIATYNYNRQKYIAEENMAKYINTQKKLLILSALLLISLCIIGTIIYYSKKKRHQHELKMQGLKAEYDKALLTLEAAQRDLKLLNYEMHSALEGKEKEVSNIVLLNGQTTFNSTTSTETIAADIASIKEKYRALIENKNQDIEQLQSNVERLHKEIKSYSIAQEDEQLRNSEIYKKIKFASSFRSGQKPLNDKDWTELTDLLRTYYPNYYSFITNNNNLSDNQLHVCMLIRLGFHQGEKCQIMNTSKSRINKIKQQINYKLFEEKGARSLSDNLRQHF